jgi:hypothetical protein
MGLGARTPTTRNQDLTGAEESDLQNGGAPNAKPISSSASSAATIREFLAGKPSPDTSHGTLGAEVPGGGLEG